MDQHREAGLHFTASYDDMTAQFAQQVRGIKDVLAAESGAVPVDLGTSNIVQGMQTLANAFSRSLDSMVESAAKSLQRAQTSLSTNKNLTAGTRERLWQSQQTEVYGQFQEQLSPFLNIERTGLAAAVSRGGLEIERQAGTEAAGSPRDYEFFSKLNNALAALSQSRVDTARPNIPEYSTTAFSDAGELAIAKAADDALLQVLRRLAGPLDVLASILKPGAIAAGAKGLSPEQETLKAFLHGVPGGSQLYSWIASGGAETLGRVSSSKRPRGPDGVLDPNSEASRELRARRQEEAEKLEARRRGPYQGGDLGTAAWLNRGFQDDLKAVTSLRLELAGINGLEELHGQLIDKNRGRYAAFKKEAENIARALGILQHAEFGEAEPASKRFMQYSGVAKKVHRLSGDLASGKLSDKERADTVEKLKSMRGVMERSGLTIDEVQEMLKAEEPTLQERIKHDQQAAARSIKDKMAEFDTMRGMVSKGEMPGGGLIALQKEEEKQLNQYVSRYGFTGLSDELKKRYMSVSQLSEGDKKQIGITLQSQFDAIVQTADQQVDPSLKKHGQLKAIRLLRENLETLGDAEISKIGGNLWKQAPILEFNEAKRESFERLTRTVRGLTAEMGKAGNQDFSIAEQLFKNVEQQKKRYGLAEDELDQLQAVMPTPMRDGKPIFTDSQGKARPINIRDAKDRGTVMYQAELEQAEARILEQHQYLENMKLGSGRRRHYEVQQYQLLKGAVDQYGNSLGEVNKLIELNKGKVSALFAYLETTFVEQLKFQLRWQAGMTAIFGTLNLIKSSVALVIQFEQALKNVEQTTQATDLDMYTLTNTIRELGASSKFGAIELSRAMIQLGQAGVAAESAGETLRAVVALATATMADLGKAADIMTSVMVAFNVDANRMSGVANILAAAINKSKLHTDTLGVAFNHMGTMASQAGLSLEETAAAAGAMSNAGVRISTVGTSMRGMLGMMLSPTERFKQALWDVGLTMSDVDVRALGLSEVLSRMHKAGFNVRSAFDAMDKRMASGAAVLIRHRDVYESLLTAVTGTSRAYDMAAEQMKPLENQLKLLHNRFQDLVLSVGGFVIGPLGILVTKTNDLGTAIGEVMDDMSPGLKVTINAAGIAAIATGQLVVAMSAFKILAGTAGFSGYFAQLNASLIAAGGAMALFKTRAELLFTFLKGHPYILAAIAVIGTISAVVKYQEAVEEAHMKERSLAKERIAVKQVEIEDLERLTKAVEKAGSVSKLSGQDLKLLGGYIPDIVLGMNALGKTAYDTGKSLGVVRAELDRLLALKKAGMQDNALTMVRLRFDDLNTAVGTFNNLGGPDRIKELGKGIQNYEQVRTTKDAYIPFIGNLPVSYDINTEAATEELRKLQAAQEKAENLQSEILGFLALIDPAQAHRLLTAIIAKTGDPSGIAKRLIANLEQYAKDAQARDAKQDPAMRQIIDTYLAKFSDASGEAIKEWQKNGGGWLDSLALQGMAANAFGVIPDAFHTALADIDVLKVENTANQIREAFNELYQKVNEFRKSDDWDGTRTSAVIFMQRAQHVAQQKVSDILMKAWSEATQKEDAEWKRRLAVVQNWAQRESEVYKDIASDEQHSHATRLKYTQLYLDRRSQLLYGGIGEAARALTEAKAEQIALEKSGNLNNTLANASVAKANAARTALVNAMRAVDVLKQESHKMNEANEADALRRELTNFSLLKDKAQAEAALLEKKQAADFDREAAVGEYQQLELQRRRFVAEKIAITKLDKLNTDHQNANADREAALLQDGERAEAKHFEVLKTLRTEKKRLIEEEVQLVMRRYDAMQTRLTAVVNRQRELVAQLFTDWSAGVNAVVSGITEGIEKPEAQLKALRDQQKYQQGYNLVGVGDPKRGDAYIASIRDMHSKVSSLDGDISASAKNAIDATLAVEEASTKLFLSTGKNVRDTFTARNSEYGEMAAKSAAKVLSVIGEVPSDLKEVFDRYIPAQRASMALYYADLAEGKGQYEGAAELAKMAKDKIFELLSSDTYLSVLPETLQDELNGLVAKIEQRIESLTKRQQGQAKGEADQLTKDLDVLHAKLNKLMAETGPAVARQLAEAIKDEEYELSKFFLNPDTLMAAVNTALTTHSMKSDAGLLAKLLGDPAALQAKMASMFTEIQTFFNNNPVDVLLKAVMPDTSEWHKRYELTEDGGWQKKQPPKENEGQGPVRVTLDEDSKSILRDIYDASRWGLQKVSRQLGDE